MGPEIVVAAFRPRPGGEERLRRLLGRHLEVLRREGLVTDRPGITMRATSDGTHVQVFEWATADAAARAHYLPAVEEIWGALTEVCEYVPPAEVRELGTRFPHFQPADGPGGSR